jgi:hypothetical protein
MEGGWLARLRWRRRGAWLWPAFVAVTILDMWIGHAFPSTGETQSLAGAALLALVLNVIAVLLLSRPLGAIARRAKTGLPPVVARDYGGRVALAAVAALLLIAGLSHRPEILQHRRALQDAITRAQAFIGDRAPDQFRRNLEYVSTYAIEPGHIYRTCVPSTDGSRTYCVIVQTDLPFASSVSFAGYEPNAVFAAGTN